MKTFNDLIFTTITHHGEVVPNAQKAVLNFKNGYGVSVILGKDFNSNGEDTYELAIIHPGINRHETHLTNEIRGWQLSAEVTEIMREVQNYPQFDHADYKKKKLRSYSVAKGHLSRIKNSLELSKNEMEEKFYALDYSVYLTKYAKILNIKEETLNKIVCRNSKI